MSNIPKIRVHRAADYTGTFAAFFGPTRPRWEVTLDGQHIVEFDNHPDALSYAHSYAKAVQRHHVEKLERDAYEARRAAEKAAGKRHTEFMDRAGRIWALAA